MSADITINDNTAQTLRDLADAIEAGLEAIGQQAASHAKTTITQAGRVDTGALRNSVESLVEPGEKAVYIGTNIEYAIYHEYGTGIYTDGGGGRQTPWVYQDAGGNWHRTRGIKPIHFLKNAASGHKAEYVDIMEQALKQGR